MLRGYLQLYNNSFVIVGNWPGGVLKENWGDKLNGELMHRLSGLPVCHIDSIRGWRDRPVYRVIGSSLAQMKKNEIVWGTGFISKTATPKEVAAQICAVRGRLTHERLKQLGIYCPEVFGDAAIFCPLLYRPSATKTHDYGVIQHFREVKTIEMPKIKDSASVKIIDITGGIEDVIKDILSCKVIVSSSLHGLICAHAYGVPAYWLKASNLPMGDDFKFHDYYSSIGHSSVAPAIVDLDGFVVTGSCPSLPVPGFLDADALLRACPFLDPERCGRLISLRKSLAKAGQTGTIFGT